VFIVKEELVMPYVACNIDEGLRPSEATVEVKDTDRRSAFLRVDREFVKFFDGNPFLPVGIVFDKNGLVLIELPHEADSGRSRLWVPRSSIKEVPSRPTAAAV
jgi:hypothetical protein